jgi:hypothetical protein
MTGKKEKRSCSAPLKGMLLLNIFSPLLFLCGLQRCGRKFGREVSQADELLDLRGKSAINRYKFGRSSSVASDELLKQLQRHCHREKFISRPLTNF